MRERQSSTEEEHVLLQLGRVRRYMYTQVAWTSEMQRLSPLFQVGSSRLQAEEDIVEHYVC